MKSLYLIIEAITSSQRQHLRGYTKGSAGLNDYLWSEHKKQDHGRSPDDIKYFQHRIKHLDNAMDRSITKKDQTVYSGSMHDPRDLKDKNDIVHHPAYLSTSKNRFVGEKFAGYHSEMKDGKRHHHNLAINVPKGSRAADLSRTKGVYDSSEKEVLLPRNSKLKYNHTESKPHQTDETGIMHTHHMSLLG